MTYRDDLDAAHGRIEALERELAEAKRGGESQALVRAERGELTRAEKAKAASRWLGAPTQIWRERVLDVVAPESCYLDIVQYLERQFGMGGRTSTALGRLEWATTSQTSGTGPFVTVTVTVASGTTTIRTEERTGNAAAAIFGGVGGGVGGGAIMAPGALLFVNPVLGAVALPLWFGGIYVLCRRIFRRSMRRRVHQLDEAVHDIAEIIEDAARAAAQRATMSG